MKQNTNRKSNWISVILTVVVFVALIKYLYDNKEILDSLKTLTVFDILVLVFLYFVYIMVLSYLNKIIIKKLDPAIRTREIIFLQFINNLLNKILPKGGVAFRATYLKQHYQLSYSYFLASFTGLVVVNLASQALISLFAILVVYFETGSFNLIIFSGFSGDPGRLTSHHDFQAHNFFGQQLVFTKRKETGGWMEDHR